ncbi:Hypothetical protein D9617_36g063010 [Elsinoe fawcettii]|nr:Hypothetical protein D9617_36g063010 [Elsinoe fawcettii]
MANPRRQRSSARHARGGQGDDARGQAQAGTSQRLRRSGRATAHVASYDQSSESSELSEPSESPEPPQGRGTAVVTDPISQTRSFPSSAGDVPATDDALINPPGRLQYDYSSFGPAERDRIKKARSSIYAPTFSIPRFTRINYEDGKSGFCFNVSNQEGVFLVPERKPINGNRLLFCTCNRGIRGTRAGSGASAQMCEHIWHLQEQIVVHYRSRGLATVKFDPNDATVEFDEDQVPVSLYDLIRQGQGEEGLLQSLKLQSMPSSPEDEERYQQASQHVLSFALSDELMPFELLSDRSPQPLIKEVCNMLLQRAAVDSTIHYQVQTMITPQKVQNKLCERLSDRHSRLMEACRNADATDGRAMESFGERLRDLSRKVAEYEDTSNTLLPETRRTLSLILLRMIDETTEIPALFAVTIARSFIPNGPFVLPELARFKDTIEQDTMTEITQLARRLINAGAPTAYITALEEAVTD